MQFELSVNAEQRLFQVPQSYKVIVVGGSNVGKSSLILRLVHDVYSESKSCARVDIETLKIRDKKGRQFELQFWKKISGIVRVLKKYCSKQIFAYRG